MSQYRSRLPATKVERCACARLCRGGLGLWRIFTNISRGFLGLLFYSFSNSQPPSARCADVLGASFQPLQTVCSRNLLAAVHTASLHSKHDFTRFLVCTECSAARPNPVCSYAFKSVSMRVESRTIP